MQITKIRKRKNALKKGHFSFFFFYEKKLKKDLH